MAHSTARKVSHQFPTLDRAVEVSQVVRGLRAYGLTQAEIGTATGAKVRAVRNWERTSATRRGTEDRLQDLRHIVLTLQRTLTERGVGQWLRARNRLLHGQRALDVLAAGNVEAVRQAADAFVEGSYV
jgi:transcriptional regulator with XRE-family HTH domain